MESDLFSVAAGASAPAVSISLPGPPHPKGRPRFRYVQPKGRPGFVNTYTDAATRAFEEAMKWKAKVAMHGRPPFEGPLAIRIFAMLPVPKSWPNKKRDAALAGTLHPIGKVGDFDNFAKAGTDPLNGVVYLDDSQIVRALVVKEYGELPGLILEIYTLP